MFVWCASDATRNMKLKDQVAQYRSTPTFAESGWLLVTGFEIIGPISKQDLSQIIDTQLVLVDQHAAFVNTKYPVLIRNSCARAGEPVFFMDVLGNAFISGEIRNPSLQRQWWKLPPLYSKFTQDKTSNALCFEVNQHYVVPSDKGYCVCSRDDGKTWKSHVRAPSEACK
jgi:hypothetical protein